METTSSSTDGSTKESMDSAYLRLEATIENFNREKLALEQRISTLLADLESRESELQKQNVEIQDLTVEVHVQRSGQEEDEKGRESVQNTMLGLEKKIQNLVDAASIYEPATEDVRNHLDTLLETNSKLKQLHLQLMERLNASHSNYSELTQKYDKLVMAEDQLHEIVSKKEADIAELVIARDNAEGALAHQLRVHATDTEKFMREIKDVQSAYDDVKEKLIFTEQRFEEVTEEKEKVFAALIAAEKKTELDLAQQTQIYTADREKFLQDVKEAHSAYMQLKEKLTASEEQCRQLDAEKESALAELVIAREKAEETQANQMRAYATDTEKLMREIKDAQLAYEDVKEKLTITERRLQEVIDEKDKSDNALVSAKKKSELDLAQQTQMYTSDRERLLQDAKDAHSAYVELKAKLTASEEQCRQLDAEKESALAEIVIAREKAEGSLAHQLRVHASDTEKLMKEIKDAQSAYDAVREKLTVTEQRLKEVTEEKENVFDTLVAAKRKSELDLAQQTQMYTADREKLLRDAEEAHSAYVKLKEKLTASEELGRQLAAEKESALAELAIAGGKAEETLAHQIRIYATDTEKLMREIKDAQSAYEDVKEKLTVTERRLNEVADEKEKVFDALVAAKKKSELDLAQQTQMYSCDKDKLMRDVQDMQTALESVKRKLASTEEKLAKTKTERDKAFALFGEDSKRKEKGQPATRGSLLTHAIAPPPRPIYAPTSSDDESSASNADPPMPIQKIVQGVSDMRVQNSPGKRATDSKTLDIKSAPKSKKMKESRETSKPVAPSTPVRKFFRSKPSVLTSTPKPKSPGRNPQNP